MPSKFNTKRGLAKINVSMNCMSILLSVCVVDVILSSAAPGDGFREAR